MESILTNLNTFYDEAEPKNDSQNYETMFEGFKLSSKLHSDTENTIVADSKTSTSSDCEPTNIFEENCELQKEFLSKKRNRRVKKICKKVSK